MGPTLEPGRGAPPKDLSFEDLSFDDFSFDEALFDEDLPEEGPLGVDGPPTFSLTTGPTLGYIGRVGSHLAYTVSRIEPWQPEFLLRGYIRVHCDNLPERIFDKYLEFERLFREVNPEEELYNNYLLIDRSGRMYCFRN